MPTSRFYNLPEEKRQRIAAAAIGEFSRVPFDQVSINQIVQTAGIPRGSFYQYFESKLDLLAFVLEDFKSETKESIQRILSQNGDPFRVMQQLLDSIVEHGSRPNTANLFQNVFPHLKLQESQKILPYLQTRHNVCAYPDFWLRLDQFLELPAYRSVSRTDLLDTLEIAVALLRHTISQLFFHFSERDQIRHTFANKLTILRRGLLGKENQYVEI